MPVYIHKTNRYMQYKAFSILTAKYIYDLSPRIFVLLMAQFFGYVSGFDKGTGRSLLHPAATALRCVGEPWLSIFLEEQKVLASGFFYSE